MQRLKLICCVIAKIEDFHFACALQSVLWTLPEKSLLKVCIRVVERLLIERLFQCLDLIGELGAFEANEVGRFPHMPRGERDLRTV